MSLFKLALLLNVSERKQAQTTRPRLWRSVLAFIRIFKPNHFPYFVFFLLFCSVSLFFCVDFMTEQAEEKHAAHMHLGCVILFIFVFCFLFWYQTSKILLLKKFPYSSYNAVWLDLCINFSNFRSDWKSTKTYFGSYFWHIVDLWIIFRLWNV